MYGIFGRETTKYAVCTVYIYTVLANPIYTVYIRYFWQGNHQICGMHGVYTYGSGQPYSQHSTS